MASRDDLTIDYTVEGILDGINDDLIEKVWENLPKNIKKNINDPESKEAIINRMSTIGQKFPNTSSFSVPAIPSSSSEFDVDRIIEKANDYIKDIGTNELSFPVNPRKSTFQNSRDYACAEKRSHSIPPITGYTRNTQSYQPDYEEKQKGSDRARTVKNPIKPPTEDGCKENPFHIPPICFDLVHKPKIQEIFQPKIQKYSRAVSMQLTELDKYSVKLEQCMSQKNVLVTSIAKLHGKALRVSNIVHQMESDITKIKLQVCGSYTLRTSENNAPCGKLCSKGLINKMIDLQHKLEKVRSRAMLKACFLDMCEAAESRIETENILLKKDIQRAAAIAKELSCEMQLIRRVVCCIRKKRVIKPKSLAPKKNRSPVAQSNGPHFQYDGLTENFRGPFFSGNEMGNEYVIGPYGANFNLDLTESDEFLRQINDVFAECSQNSDVESIVSGTRVRKRAGSESSSASLQILPFRSNDANQPSLQESKKFSEEEKQIVSFTITTSSSHRSVKTPQAHEVKREHLESGTTKKDRKRKDTVKTLTLQNRQKMISRKEAVKSHICDCGKVNKRSYCSCDRKTLKDYPELPKANVSETVSASSHLLHVTSYDNPNAHEAYPTEIPLDFDKRKAFVVKPFSPSRSRNQLISKHQNTAVSVDRFMNATVGGPVGQGEKQKSTPAAKYSHQNLDHQEVNENPKPAGSYQNSDQGKFRSSPHRKSYICPNDRNKAQEALLGISSPSGLEWGLESLSDELSTQTQKSDVIEETSEESCTCSYQNETRPYNCGNCICKAEATERKNSADVSTKKSREPRKGMAKTMLDQLSPTNITKKETQHLNSSKKYSSVISSNICVCTSQDGLCKCPPCSCSISTRADGIVEKDLHTKSCDETRSRSKSKQGSKEAPIIISQTGSSTTESCTCSICPPESKEENSSSPRSDMNEKFPSEKQNNDVRERISETLRDMDEKSSKSLSSLLSRWENDDQERTVDSYNKPIRPPSKFEQSVADDKSISGKFNQDSKFPVEKDQDETENVPTNQSRPDVGKDIKPKDMKPSSQQDCRRTEDYSRHKKKLPSTRETRKYQELESKSLVSGDRNKESVNKIDSAMLESQTRDKDEITDSVNLTDKSVEKHKDLVNEIIIPEPCLTFESTDETGPQSETTIYGEEPNEPSKPKSRDKFEVLSKLNGTDTSPAYENAAQSETSATESNKNKTEIQKEKGRQSDKHEKSNENIQKRNIIPIKEPSSASSSTGDSTESPAKQPYIRSGFVGKENGYETKPDKPFPRSSSIFEDKLGDQRPRAPPPSRRPSSIFREEIRETPKKKSSLNLGNEQLDGLDETSKPPPLYMEPRNLHKEDIGKPTKKQQSANSKYKRERDTTAELPDRNSDHDPGRYSSRRPSKAPSIRFEKDSAAEPTNKERIDKNPIRSRSSSQAPVIHEGTPSRPSIERPESGSKAPNPQDQMATSSILKLMRDCQDKLRECQGENEQLDFQSKSTATHIQRLQGDLENCRKNYEDCLSGKVGDTSVLKQISSLQNENSRLIQEMNHLKVAANKVEIDNDVLREENEKLRAQLQQYSSEQNKISVDCLPFIQKIANLESRIVRITKENEDIVAECADYKFKLSKCQEELSSCLIELTKAPSEVSDEIVKPSQTTNCKEWIELVNKYEVTLKKYRMRSVKLAFLAGISAKQRDQLKTEVAEMEIVLENCQNELRKCLTENHMLPLQNQIETMRGELKKQKDTINRLETSNDQLEREKKNMLLSLETAKANLEKCEDEIQNIKIKGDTYLGQQYTKLRTENNQLAAEIDNKNQVIRKLTLDLELSNKQCSECKSKLKLCQANADRARRNDESIIPSNKDTKASSIENDEDQSLIPEIVRIGPDIQPSKLWSTHKQLDLELEIKEHYRDVKLTKKMYKFLQCELQKVIHKLNQIPCCENVQDELSRIYHATNWIKTRICRCYPEPRELHFTPKCVQGSDPVLHGICLQVVVAGVQSLTLRQLIYLHCTVYKVGTQFAKTNGSRFSCKYFYKQLGHYKDKHGKKNKAMKKLKHLETEMDNARKILCNLKEFCKSQPS